MKFTQGQEVVLSEIGRRRWKNSPENPHGKVGRFSHYTNITSTLLPAVVDWGNTTNSYEEEDLMPAYPPKAEDYL